MLGRVPAPNRRAVIDEVGIARAPRDPQIGKIGKIGTTSFRHLITFAERPGITVQVIGPSAGMHPGLGKQLMGGRVPDVAYTEGVADPIIVEQDETVQPYRPWTSYMRWL